MRKHFISYKLKQKIDIIVDSLNILSQLARLSKEYYEGIHQIMIYPELKILIQHSEACKLKII